MSAAVATVINIVGDFVFVFGLPPLPAMGPAWIAFASALAAMAAIAVNLYFLKIRRGRQFYSGPWRLARETVIRVAGISWPVVAVQAAWNIGTVIIFAILGRLGESGTVALRDDGSAAPEVEVFGRHPQNAPDVGLQVQCSVSCLFHKERRFPGTSSFSS